MTTAIAHATQPSDWVDWMFERIEIERREKSNSLTCQLTEVRGRIVEADEKLKRLMEAYLDRIISIAEYGDNKLTLSEEKVTFRAEPVALE